ncbi:MAG: fructose bisphosphate aldolase [Actinomycetes bacterium]
MDSNQKAKIAGAQGFVAALDQSGGSTPKALRLYGIPEEQYSGDAEMFDRVHAMRERIVMSPSFDGDRILATILFEQTMDRTFDGVPAAEYLWESKRIVPILKVDQGLQAEAHGVRLMKPMERLDDLLERARAQGIFGTKMRSVVSSADAGGIAANVAQQFEYAEQIADAGFVPILEPEVDIKASDKDECEHLVLEEIMSRLDSGWSGAPIMFKLTLPEEDGLYTDLVAHAAVLRVVALSGGYTRDEACQRLARQPGVVASFSRALTEGLRVDQSDADFDATLDASIAQIYAASVT